jgi:predicted MFS family arabinose efflux permease
MFSEHSIKRTQSKTVAPHAWSAVGAMTLCVAMLIASEFMPVSLLTPIAADLKATEGMAGQAISVSGFFALVTSFFIANIAGRYDRRYILTGLAALMLASLALIAAAPSFVVLMTARALLGVTIGGFWSLSTATIMRLVPEAAVPKALAVLFTGNAIATAFAAPLGSYMGSVIGWRGVFWALTPIVLANVIWLWRSIPSMPPQRPIPVTQLLGLLKRRHVAFATVAQMLSYGGAFTIFTYLRPFLETRTRADVPQLSLLLLSLGVAGFFGTYGASLLLRRHSEKLLIGLPLLLGLVSVGLLTMGKSLGETALMMFLWGAINSAIPVAWSSWLTRRLPNDAEAGGGLMVGGVQLAIMLGGAFGGLLLDRLSITATFLGGIVLLAMAAITLICERHSIHVADETGASDESNGSYPSGGMRPAT